MIQTPQSEVRSSFVFYLTLALLWVVPGAVFWLATVLAGGAPHTHVIDWPYSAIRSAVQSHGQVRPWEWVGARTVRSVIVFWTVVAVVVVPTLAAIMLAGLVLRGGIPAVFPFLSQPRMRSRWATLGTLTRSSLTVPGATGRRLLLGRHRNQWIAAREGTSVLAFGAPGSGKTASLCIPAIGEWEGSVVAVSDKPDLVVTTAGLRQHRGRVDVLDLSGSTEMATASWSPAGPPLTFDEAEALVSQVLEGRQPAPDEATRQVLTCTLYAAANQGLGAAAAVEWLDDLTGDTLLRSLLHVSDRDPRATSLVSRIKDRDRDERAASFSAARQLMRAHFEQAAPGASGRSFQPAEFLAGVGNTLFVVTGSDRASAARVGPLLQTLVAGAEERQPRRPLLFVLDGSAAVTSMPEVGALLASRSLAVMVLAVLRGPDELIRQGGLDLQTLIDRARTVVFAGGGENVEDAARRAEAEAGQSEKAAEETRAAARKGEATAEAAAAAARSAESAREAAKRAEDLRQAREVVLELTHQLVRGQLSARRALPLQRTWGEAAPDLLPPDAARQLGFGRALLVQDRMPPAVLWLRNCYEDPELQERLSAQRFVPGVVRITTAS